MKNRNIIGSQAHHTAPLLDNLAQEKIKFAFDTAWDSYTLISEEIDGNIYVKGEDVKDLCFIADPLDGSAFARRRMPPASVSLCAYSRKLQKPIASAVTDIFFDCVYFASEDKEGAWCEFTDGLIIKLVTSECRSINKASISTLCFEKSRL